MWVHGYWKTQEAHHGTEHFELFLGTLARLDPTDERTRAQLLDAAEHIGNWVDEIPAWYDEETGLFRSFYLGTEYVGDEGSQANVAAHLRFANICLIAYELSRGARYLRFAEAYLGRWAEAILASPEGAIPTGLTPSGPVYAGRGPEGYHRAVGQLNLEGNVGAVEALLASNGPGAFLRMWRHTPHPTFLRAAERLLDVLVTQLSDPDAGSAADAFRAYRNVTGLRRYDAAVLRAIDGLPVEGIQEIGIEPKVVRAAKPEGIGKRRDMPNWFEDGAPRRANPILLALGAEIAGDAGLATRALDMGRTYLALAREVYPDGRAHGCSAQSVSAIARGHGRDNNAGVATAVLAPLLEAFGET
jgi:hypothetical protein